MELTEVARAREPDLLDMEVEEATENHRAMERAWEIGRRAWIDFGLGLGAMRDRRGYRALGFPTFEDYCQQCWGMTRQHGNRLIRAVDLAGNLEPIGSKLPESQVRELMPLLVEEGESAVLVLWEELREQYGDRVTATLIREAVQACLSGNGQGIGVHASSASATWNTPPDIIRRVVDCLGSIDLDPCSNDGEPNVPAAMHYTEADDGLQREWAGRVYMNPPYGGEIGWWVDKLAESYENGAVSAAIALVPARTDTRWFGSLRDAALCFIAGRLHFSDAENSAPFPSVAAYLGPDVAAFVEAFDDMGDIWRRVEL